ncbi:hypothetical protein [Burkholderia pseudomallei]|uniref:hypothetical protein n=1 Tax=Burkholderia pseudomallei TaxID=28450 RepID=UPI0018A1F51C|nr:hypothetical protein [Burkholderia pseudomallei]
MKVQVRVSGWHRDRARIAKVPSDALDCCGETYAVQIIGIEYLEMYRVAEGIRNYSLFRSVTVKSSGITWVICCWPQAIVSVPCMRLVVRT